MRTKAPHILCGFIFIMFAAQPAAAGLIGSSFFISDGGDRFPDVAYGSVNGNYLVAWADYSYSPVRVCARLVTNGGAVSGNIFCLSSGIDYALYPAIAYNATNNEFLVTWDDGALGNVIAGQRVRGSDGALLGGNFAACSVVGGGRSAVAWSSTSNNYLVACSNFDEV